MNGIYVGIDVGGTHTDGVAVEGNSILHKVKVPTQEDLQACTLEALEELLEGLPPREIRRVVLSTTLVTNAVIQGRLEPGAIAHPVSPCLIEPVEDQGTRLGEQRGSGGE